MPNLVGMTPEKAEVALEELNLKMEIGESVTSDEVEKGEIAAQNPPKGEKVEKGDTITVMLSSGKPTGLVPQLVGTTFVKENVEAILQANNYNLGGVSYEESDAPEGQIINQDPGAGTEAEKGTIVNITVSKGTDKVAVPKLIGLTIDEARAEIEKAGFTFGNPSYEESTVYAKNIVMGANYSEGEKVQKGATINLTISSGVAEVTPPEPDKPDSGSKEEGNNGNGSGNGNANGNDGGNNADGSDEE